MKKTKFLSLFSGFAIAVAGLTAAVVRHSNKKTQDVFATDYSKTIRVYVDLNWSNISYMRIGGNSESDNAILTESDSKYDTSKGKYVRDISTSSTYGRMGCFFKQGDDKWAYQYDDGYVWIDSSKFQPGYAFRIYNINWVSDGNPKKFSASVERIGTIPDDPQTYHTVTYDVNGSKDAAPVQPDVNEGSTFTVANGVSKENNHFTGWSDGINTYQPNDSYTMGTSDVTLTAQWSPYAVDNGYYVVGSFNDWTGSQAFKMLPTGKTDEYSVSISLTANDVFGIQKYENDAKTTFRGYSKLDPNCGAAERNEFIQDENNIKAVYSGNYTIYLKTSGYHDSYDISCGGLPRSTVSLHVLDREVVEQHATSYSEFVPNYTFYETDKPGYYFDGWYTDEQFSKPYTPVIITENTVLYAKFTAFTENVDVYIDFFNWSTCNIYVYESINGVEYHTHGTWGSAENAVEVLDSNLTFNNGMLQKVTLSVKDADNAKFVYYKNAGSDADKSSSMNVHSGSYYYHDGSQWTEKLAGGEDGYADAAEYVYSLNDARMKVAESDPIKQYSICGLSFTDWVNSYNSKSDNAKALIDSASIKTYNKTTGEYDATVVTYAEIIAEFNAHILNSNSGIKALDSIIDGDNVMLVVMLVSVVGLTAIGGFFYYKKRKQY